MGGSRSSIEASWVNSMMCVMSPRAVKKKPPNFAFRNNLELDVLALEGQPRLRVVKIDYTFSMLSDSSSLEKSIRMMYRRKEK